MFIHSKCLLQGIVFRYRRTSCRYSISQYNTKPIHNKWDSSIKQIILYTTSSSIKMNNLVHSEVVNLYLHLYLRLDLDMASMQ